MIDSSVFRDADLLRLFLWLLLRASFTEHTVAMTTGRGITLVPLKPGQCIVGRNKSSQELGWAASSFRNRLGRLRKMQIIETLQDTHWTVVSIVNWGKYQSPDNDERTGIRTTKGQPKDNQRTQDKNDKNDENEKNEKNTVASLVSCEPFDLLWKAYPPRNGKRLGKSEARKAFMKINPMDHADVMIAVAKYASSGQMPKDASRFLKEDYWRDWLTTATGRPENVKEMVRYRREPQSGSTE